MVSQRPIAELVCDREKKGRKEKKAYTGREEGGEGKKERCDWTSRADTQSLLTISKGIGVVEARRGGGKKKKKKGEHHYRKKGTCFASSISS